MTSIASLETFDAAQFLDDEESIAEYLSNMLADGDAATTQHALGVAVRAAGMMKVCKASGLTRQGINKATRPDSNPSFHTVNAITRALGLKLQFVQESGAGQIAA